MIGRKRRTELWGYLDSWNDIGVPITSVDFDPPSGQDWKVVRVTSPTLGGGAIERDMSYEQFYDRFVPLYVEIQIWKIP